MLIDGDEAEWNEVQTCRAACRALMRSRDEAEYRAREQRACADRLAAQLKRLTVTLEYTDKARGRWKQQAVTGSYKIAKMEKAAKEARWEMAEMETTLDRVTTERDRAYADLAPMQSAESRALDRIVQLERELAEVERAW